MKTRMLRVWIFVILASVWLPGAICVGSPDPLTYWIDASCDSINYIVKPAIEGARTMAKRAAARLPPDYSNPYMHEAFVRVFHWLKVTRANEQDPNSQLEPTLEYLKVYRVLDTIGNYMTETTNRKASEVRIYCDDDRDVDQGGRWSPIPVQNEDPEDIKNSNLPGSIHDKGLREDYPEDGPWRMWEDKTNWIRREAGTRGCQHNQPQFSNDNNNEGISYRNRYMSKADHPDFDEGENENRVTITLCDQHIRELALASIDTYRDEGMFPQNQPHGPMNEPAWVKNVKMLQDPVSVTVLHELTHITRPDFNLEDVSWVRLIPENPDDSDGEGTKDLDDPANWADPYDFIHILRRFGRPDSYINAESVAIIAALARAADFGYRLADVSQMSNGELVFDPHLEKIGGENYQRRKRRANDISNTTERLDLVGTPFSA